MDRDLKGGDTPGENSSCQKPPLSLEQIMNIWAPVTWPAMERKRDQRSETRSQSKERPRQPGSEDA
jgi:hypothetical protein